MIRSALMNVMTAAAIKAGRGLKRDFGEVENLQVSVKGPGDFVSAADRKSEQVLFEELSKARPGYSFVMEERGSVPGPDPDHTWHVDPLDGTTNFLHGLPHFNISVALERDGQLVAGLVYNPASDELVMAEKSKGCYLMGRGPNDRRMRVAARKSLGDAVVSTGIPHRGRTHHSEFLREIKATMPEVAGIRRTGSAALDLAWTAAGRLDAYWEHNIQPWDMAAGIVLVREAGGIVSDLDGGADMLGRGSVLAGNAPIHKAMLEVLKGSRG